MDRREPARIIDAETVSPDRPIISGSRWRPLSPRSLWIGGAAFAAAILVVIAVGNLIRSRVDSLHRSPIRTCRFREIVLDPPLPPFILPDRREFLERLRREAGLPEDVHTLDSKEMESIRLAFETRLPWAKKIVKVEPSYPNRLVVTLEYREPVAFVPMKDAASLFVDADGVVLPADELETRAPGIDRLIQLTFPRGQAPMDARPGRALAVGDGPDARSRIEPVLAFAGLAAELKRRGGIPGRLRFRKIERHSERFWVTVDDDVSTENWTWVAWGEPPGSERAGEPSAEEKWVSLAAWAAKHSVSEARNPAFLRFGASGIEIHRGRADPG